jgi:hypothetical protein
MGSSVRIYPQFPSVLVMDVIFSDSLRYHAYRCFTAGIEAEAPRHGIFDRERVVLWFGIQRPNAQFVPFPFSREHRGWCCLSRSCHGPSPTRCYRSKAIFLYHALLIPFFVKFAHITHPISPTCLS